MNLKGLAKRARDFGQIVAGPQDALLRRSSATSKRGVEDTAARWAEDRARPKNYEVKEI